MAPARVNFRDKCVERVAFATRSTQAGQSRMGVGHGAGDYGRAMDFPASGPGDSAHVNLSFDHTCPRVIHRAVSSGPCTGLVANTGW